MPNLAIDLVVGTYPRLGGGGLTPLRYDPATGRWTAGAPVAAITDASFGTYAARHGRHYFVEENDHGRVASYAGPAEHWRQASSAETRGAAPCHVALDPEQRRLAVANYESGSVALYRLADDGSLLDSPSIHQLTGSGPNPERQEQSHAHWVGFDRDGQRLFCVDLGADRIVTFSIDSDDLPEPNVAYQALPGSGPRHLAFHPHAPLAFLISELASTLTVLAVADNGTFAARQIVSTLPAPDPESLGGAIAINRAGDRLYVSNRGHDSIAVFAIEGGEVRPLQHVPSGGASPRHILLLEDDARLLVANEEGGSVGVFTIGPDGMLAPDPVMLDIPGAVFLARVEG